MQAAEQTFYLFYNFGEIEIFIKKMFIASSTNASFGLVDSQIGQTTSASNTAANAISNFSIARHVRVHFEMALPKILI